MKKESRDKPTDELRPEYNFADLKDGVRGKYHERMTAGTNLLLIDPAPQTQPRNPALDGPVD